MTILPTFDLYKFITLIKNMELNRIYNENCLDTMSRMPNDFIDLTVTSPPYDNLRDYQGYSFDFESIAKELFRVTKEGGVVVWVVGDSTINGSETGTSFKQALYFKEIGFNLHDTMIYKKYKAPCNEENRHMYKDTFEFMFILSKCKPLIFNAIKIKSISPGTKSKKGQYDAKSGKLKDRNSVTLEYRIQDNIWQYSFINDKTDHPAVFPEKLVSDHIYTWSNKGDLIYDPFMGSGTTAKSAHLLDRNWIGSEMSKEYTDLANKRINPYLQQTKLF